MRTATRSASLAVLATTALLAVSATAALAANNLRISQIYGGGGNAGAQYRNDFIEIYNAGTSAASLAGMSVQYASTAGTTWSVTLLSGSIGAGKYYLVQESSSGAVGALLPTPDATGTIAMSATAAKVALVNGTGALSGACPGSLVDFVGYGTGTNCFEGAGVAPTLSNTTADARKSNFTDKNKDTDQNSTDFLAGPPCPRNSAVVTDPCGPTAVPSSTWGTIKSMYR